MHKWDGDVTAKVAEEGRIGSSKMSSRGRGFLVIAKLCHLGKPGAMPSVREKFWLHQEVS